MRVFARIGLRDGTVIDLGPGDIIGRLPWAALRVNDPRISEAHALVSLRGPSLKLLALRGRFHVGGQVVNEVVLEPGIVLQLAADIELRVLAIGLPRAVLAIEGVELPRQILPPVAALIAGDPPSLLPRFDPKAAALFWSDGDDFYAQIAAGTGERVVVHEGFAFRVDTREFRIVSVDLDLASQRNTERNDLSVAPLKLILRYDSVHIHRGDETIIVSGIPARILTEAALFRMPVEWRTVAQMLWTQESDDVSLRQKWDRGLARLRQKLREARLRVDMLHTDGAGRVELALGPRDTVIDET